MNDREPNTITQGTILTFGKWLVNFLNDHPNIEIRYGYQYDLNAIRIRMASYDCLPVKFIDRLIPRNDYETIFLCDTLLIETVKRMYEQLISEEIDGSGN